MELTEQIKSIIQIYNLDDLVRPWFLVFHNHKCHLLFSQYFLSLKAKLLMNDSKAMKQQKKS